MQQKIRCYTAAQLEQIAQQLLRRGEKPTAVHLRCGFSTYPAFYKRYVEYFGYAPSEERSQRMHADAARL